MIFPCPKGFKMMLLTYLSYAITLVCVGALVSIAFSLLHIMRLLRKIDWQNLRTQPAGPAPTAATERKIESLETQALDDEKRMAIFRAAAADFLGTKVHVVKFREAGQTDWILNGSFEPKQG
jgi:hypothetical protein